MVRVAYTLQVQHRRAQLLRVGGGGAKIVGKSTTQSVSSPDLIRCHKKIGTPIPIFLGLRDSTFDLPPENWHMMTAIEAFPYVDVSSIG